MPHSGVSGSVVPMWVERGQWGHSASLEADPPHDEGTNRRCMAFCRSENCLNQCRKNSCAPISSFWPSRLSATPSASLKPLGSSRSDAVLRGVSGINALVTIVPELADLAETYATRCTGCAQGVYGLCLGFFPRKQRVAFQTHPLAPHPTERCARGRAFAKRGTPNSTFGLLNTPLPAQLE